MRRFELHRDDDETGVSGTGRVAEGVELWHRQCVLTWFGPHTSVAVYANIGTIDAVHGHNGKTRIVWLDK